MTPEEKFIDKIKKWHGFCEKADKLILKKEDFDIGFKLTHIFLNEIIKEYEDEKFGEF